MQYFFHLNIIIKGIKIILIIYIENETICYYFDNYFYRLLYFLYFILIYSNN